jgi:8-oxo-dGTP pyrophosphatase MutT (NUDIX family)
MKARKIPKRYIPTKGSKDDNVNLNLNLNLNNKRVGVIRKVDGGFAYFPGGRAKYRGETFVTINDVMNDVGAM